LASILANSGLADLATPDPAEYVRIAQALGRRPRSPPDAAPHSLREQIRSTRCGQTQQFAADFYDLVAKTVRPQG
jgi:hypothetical protein